MGTDGPEQDSQIQLEGPEPEACCSQVQESVSVRLICSYSCEANRSLIFRYVTAGAAESQFPPRNPPPPVPEGRDKIRFKVGIFKSCIKDDNFCVICMQLWCITKQLVVFQVGR